MSPFLWQWISSSSRYRQVNQILSSNLALHPAYILLLSACFFFLHILSHNTYGLGISAYYIFGGIWEKYSLSFLPLQFVERYKNINLLLAR